MQLNDDGIAELHPDSPLRRAALEVEQHVGSAGWDQPPRLFALVPTADLVAAEPHLAAVLGDGADGNYTSIEQEDLPADRPFEEMLGSIEWPASVAGCAAVIERLMVPASAEDALPVESVAAAAAVAAHPEREEVRLVAAVLRDGAAHSAVRSRRQGAESDLLEGPALVPALVSLLAATLDDA